MDLDHLNFVLNRLLPDDVKLYNMSCMYDPRKDIIPPDQQVFHATGAALGRYIYIMIFLCNTYSYFIFSNVP